MKAESRSEEIGREAFCAPLKIETTIKTITLKNI